MRIEEIELLKFYTTYKYEIFDDVDFDKYHIKSVILDGVVDGIISSVINIHSNEPEETRAIIEGVPVSLSTHIIMSRETPIKDFIVFLRKRKIDKIISSV